jgi:hypothetical protein
MKMAASWAEKDMGLVVALLVGALTLGSASPMVLIGLCVLWGITVVADSAQFSASIAELSEPSLVGSMLTIRTCIGFLLTLVTIHLIPHVVEILTWKYAFAVLGMGPFLGTIAMARLRSMKEAVALAVGRR